MFVFNPNKYLLNEYAVFTIEDVIQRIHYVGYAKYSQVLAMSKPRRHPKFTTVFPADSLAIINVLDTHKHLYHAQNQVCEWIKTQAGDHPMTLMTPYPAGRKGIAVECVETGEIFETVTQAARSAGVSQGYMSKHLRGDPDSMKIANSYTFRWANSI